MSCDCAENGGAGACIKQGIAQRPAHPAFRACAQACFLRGYRRKRILCPALTCHAADARKSVARAEASPRIGIAYRTFNILATTMQVCRVARHVCAWLLRHHRRTRPRPDRSFWPDLETPHRSDCARSSDAWKVIGQAIGPLQRTPVASSWISCWHKANQRSDLCCTDKSYRGVCRNSSALAVAYY